MDEQNELVIIDDEGNEYLTTILFTFDSEDYGKKYAVVSLPDDDESIFVFSYTEEGDLSAVDDEEELEMCQEVINTYFAEFGDDEEDSE